MLNPFLFHRLQIAFKHVAISNENSRAWLRSIPIWAGNKGCLGTTGTNFGEQYRVNCPFCSDTRQRLYLSYLYGERDSESGSDGRQLAHCFNEDCLSDSANRRQLWDKLDILGVPTDDTPSFDADKLTLPQNPWARSIPLPDNIVSIVSSEASPKAVAYLAERGFDIRELWDYWRVSYCAENASVKPYFKRRIVIPIFRSWAPRDPEHRLDVVGWQARTLVGSDNGAPKYLTAAGFPKSLYLYGAYWAARHRGPLVICEGVTDVWRLHVNAVAILGKSFSPAHNNRVIELVRDGRPIVVCLDRDAGHEAAKIAATLAHMLRDTRRENRVEVLKLPKGRNDIGECTREEAWSAIAKCLGKSLKRLGVDLEPASKPRFPKILKRKK